MIMYFGALLFGLAIGAVIGVMIEGARWRKFADKVHNVPSKGKYYQVTYHRHPTNL